MDTQVNVSKDEHSISVQKMFHKIAPKYDLMNRIMTGGQDIRWRREVIRLAKVNPSATLLDLGAGTGDLAREGQKQHEGMHTIAADFTLNMMRFGRKENDTLTWSTADALNLPFPDEQFDAIVSGFLMRNVTDISQALREQYRALKPGGRIVILDTTKPRKNLLSPLINIHLHHIIPFIGGLVTGERDAYTYLPASTEKFLKAEELASYMAAIGFKNINFNIKMFGTIAIHWGAKE